MIERLLSRMLIPARNKSDERRFSERQITIEEHGEKPEKGLVLFTHPTIEDALIVRRTLPGAFTLVTARELSPTRFDRINRLKAIVVSAMVPVYEGDPKKRKLTYKSGAKVLNGGGLLAVAPTGRTTYSAEIPTPEDLNVNGILKILRASKKNNSFVTPLVSFVPQESIGDGGTIVNAATVKVLYGKQVQVPRSFLTEGVVSEADIEKFKNDVYQSWVEAKAQIIK